MKKIAFDLDDVLTDTTEQLTAYHNKLYSANNTIADHTDFDLTKIWKLPEEKCRAIADDYLGQHLHELSPHPDSHDALKKLFENGFEIAIVSSRPVEIRDNTIEWIRKHYSDIPIEYYPAGQENLKIDGRKKSEICQDIGAEYIVDDAPHHANDCVEAGIFVYLWDMPWNQQVPESNLLKRIYDWPELIDHLLKKQAEP